jgi:hypothetical protein
MSVNVRTTGVHHVAGDAFRIAWERYMARVITGAP